MSGEAAGWRCTEIKRKRNNSSAARDSQEVPDAHTFMKFGNNKRVQKSGRIERTGLFVLTSSSDQQLRRRTWAASTASSQLRVRETDILRITIFQPAVDQIQSRGSPACWAQEPQRGCKSVDIPIMTELKVQESNFSPAGKETFKQIISKANVVWFKNDCRDLGPKYVHTIVGGTSPPVPNETRNCQRDGHNSKTQHLEVPDGTIQGKLSRDSQRFTGRR